MITDKITKLLALARDNGATEAEAERAMELASRLMLKHNISEESLQRDTGPRVSRGDAMSVDSLWMKYCAHAAATLYHVQPLNCGASWVFVGRAENIHAAQETYKMLIDSVERFYKLALPRGMSKKDRAEYRKSFKDACAVRVYQRAVEIDRRLESESQAAVGSTALVVIDMKKTLANEIDEFFASIGARTGRSERGITIKPNQGSADGYKAGNNIQLNRALSH